MKKLLIILLCAMGSVLAESRVLAPVIDSSTYPSGSASGSGSPSTNSMYEVFGRLEQMQMEIQQLRGIVEEQSQQIVDLKKRQTNIYSDLDLRLQELSGVEVKDRAGFISEGTEVKKESGVISTKSTVTKQAKASNIDNPQVKSHTVEKPDTVDVSNVALVKDQSVLYQEAYETLRNGHNSRAISKFKSLLTEFPDGDYAANSQYWLGEAYKVNNDYELAKRAFQKVVSQYGKSLKVPDALLKLGYIEYDQNNFAQARDYLTQVTGRFPKSTAAHLASKKLTQIGVPQP